MLNINEGHLDLPTRQSLRELEIRRIKVLCVIGAFANPIWGLAAIQYFPNQIDSMLVRYCIMSFFLGVAGLMHIRPSVGRFQDEIVMALALVYTGHAIWIAELNNWTPHSAIGFAMTVSVVFSVFSKWRSSAIYATSMILAYVVLTLLVPEERHLVPILLWFSTSILLGFATNYSRYLTLASSLNAQKEISAIVNNMIEGVVVCDTDARMIFANLAAHQILGVPDGSLINLRLDDPNWQIFWENGEPMKFEERPYALALRNKIAVKDVTMVVRAKDGKEQIMSLTAVPIINDETKDVERIIITYQDLTEVKASETVVLQQREMMIHSQRLSSLGEMAGGIAHEINTPLSVILLNSTTLDTELQKSQPDLEKVRKQVQRILRTVGTIDRIVKGMRALSASEKNTPFDRVPFEKVMEMVLDLSKERLTQKGIDMTIQGNEVEMMCRPAQLAQVLINLINNAVDAITDAPRKWIRIEVKPSKGNVVIAISDSGPGVPPNLQQKILEPFFTTKPVGQGMGLGLSISKRIISEHFGELSYESPDGISRFVIRLPI